ncbi:hypothetical protein GUJ93_ZPchr0010g7874 [Zizania palustris]|uniref:Uncharacterized protein n=1 Tax=Zizania palustris TaxID=103762 RepID=A0A8J6BNH8_ZIZPA|nr:hypothetical protein GUJ93_ZPchr0010g7874 [Zizania palustris]
MLFPSSRSAEGIQCRYCFGFLALNLLPPVKKRRSSRRGGARLALRPQKPWPPRQLPWRPEDKTAKDLAWKLPPCGPPP